MRRHGPLCPHMFLMRKLLPGKWFSPVTLCCSVEQWTHHGTRQQCFCWQGWGDLLGPRGCGAAVHGGRASWIQETHTPQSEPSRDPGTTRLWSGRTPSPAGKPWVGVGWAGPAGTDRRAGSAAGARAMLFPRRPLRPAPASPALVLQVPSLPASGLCHSRLRKHRREKRRKVKMRRTMLPVQKGLCLLLHPSENPRFSPKLLSHFPSLIPGLIPTTLANSD